MNEEFRRARRRQVSDDIAVSDVMTGAVVGRIGNVSESGMLLMASQPLTEDALYQFGFQLPETEGKSTAYELGVHILWSESAGAPGTAWTGLRFIAVPDDQAARLRTWIATGEGPPA